MMTIKRLSLILAVTLCALFITAQGQTPRMTSINITPEADRVHISAVGEATEMRVEVSDEQGDVVFQSGAIAGQQLDWKMTDTQGERVATGSYLVAVTYRNAAGKLKKRVEQVTVDEVEKASTVSPAAPAATPTPVPVNTTGTVSAGQIPKFVSIGPSQATVTNSIIKESAAKIGIGASAPVSKLHIVSAVTDKPPRLQSSGTTSFAAGWDFYHGTTPKGYVGVPGIGVGEPGPGEMLLYGSTGVKTSLWAGGKRAVTIDTLGDVGIGTPSPQFKLHVDGGAFTGVYGYGDPGVAGESSDGEGVKGYSAGGHGVFGNSDTGIGVYGKSTSNYAGQFDGKVLVNDFLDVNQYTSGGTATVCRNGSRLAVCGSSLRYKTAVRPFLGGLELINRLRPISFTWKSNGTPDLGLGAEDVAEVEPLLVTHNERGEVEGVKYERLNVVLINAIKEHQAEIHRQQQLNKRQQQLILRLEARLAQVERSVKRRHSSLGGAHR